MGGLGVGGGAPKDHQSPPGPKSIPLLYDFCCFGGANSTSASAFFFLALRCVQKQTLGGSTGCRQSSLNTACFIFRSIKPGVATC